MTRRIPVGLTLAAAVALAILIGLGVWQLQRRAWKEDILARIDRLEQADPIPLENALKSLSRGEDVDFRRVRARCPGLASGQWLELYALHEGQAGVRLISACRLRDAAYGSILVDRGFVADTISARPPRDPESTVDTAIVGVLRTPDRPSPFAAQNTPRRWFRREIPAMAEALAAPAPAPVFLMAETSTNPEWLALKPVPVPTQIANRHLEYALTWFGLAGALLAVYAAMLVRRWKQG